MFFTYVATALICVVLVGVTSFKFNSVTVFSRKIKSPSISNTKWILFYAANAVRCGGASGLAAPAVSCRRGCEHLANWGYPVVMHWCLCFFTVLLLAQSAMVGIPWRIPQVQRTRCFL